MSATTEVIHPSGVLFDWRDKLEEAVRKQLQKSSVNLENFGLVSLALTGIRCSYVAVGEIWKTEWIQNFFKDNKEQLNEIEKKYAEVGNIVNISRLLNVVGFVCYIPKFNKAVGKVLEKDRVGIKRVDQGLKALFAASMIGENFATVVRGLEAVKLSITAMEVGVPWLDTALKTAFTWATSLWVYSVLFSAVSLVINARSWLKTRNFANEFMKEVGYNAAGQYTQANYQQLKNYFNIYDKDGALDRKKVAHLQRYFQADGEILAARIEVAFQKGIQTLEDQQKLAKLMDLLKDRIKTTQRNHLISLIGNAGSLISSIMVITSFLHPLGYVGLGIYAAAMIGNFIYKKVSAYNFETKIGMVNRETDDPMYATVKGYEQTEKTIGIRTQIFDFMKWFCYQLPYYKKDEVNSWDRFNKQEEMTGGIFSTADSGTLPPEQQGATPQSLMVSQTMYDMCLRLNIDLHPEMIQTEAIKA